MVEQSKWAHFGICSRYATAKGHFVGRSYPVHPGLTILTGRALTYGERSNFLKKTRKVPDTREKMTPLHAPAEIRKYAIIKSVDFLLYKARGGGDIFLRNFAFAELKRLRGEESRILVATFT